MKRQLTGLSITGLLILALTACSPGATWQSVAPQVRQQVTSLLTNPATQVNASPTSAIQDVVQRGNQEQVQALETHNSAVMQDTSTASYYKQVAQLNENLLASGITSIKLVQLRWGPVTANGSTASATTYETWSTTYSDGTTDQSTDRNVYTLVNQQGQWKISADAHPDQVNIPAGGQPGGPGTTSPPRALGPGESHNWSGYAASGSNFTGVHATWTVPDGSNGSNIGTDATWVGIGGVHSHDLLQAGTEEIVATAGHAQFQAWLELLPMTSHPVPLAVAPGNSVSVAIDQQASGQWKVSFKNNTSGATYATTVSYTSSHSSADWVEEAPSAGRGVLPLDNFGKVAFSQAGATQNGKSVTAEQAGAKAITMVNAADQPLAIPSALGKDGASFSVTRTSNPAGQFPRSSGRVGLGFGSGHRGG